MKVDKIHSNMTLKFEISRNIDLTIKTNTGIIAVVRRTAIIK
jgi:hypothetical protein